jgi:hypothetical protein
MNRTKSIIVSLLMTISISSFSQGCEKLLEGGLYSFTKMTNTGSFNQDLRTYYLSDQFKSDVKNGKWGSSVTIPIGGLPVTLGADFSEAKYSEFRNRLLSISELNISQTFYQTSFSSIPNFNLYTSYVECVKIEKDVSKVGFIQGVNVESEDIVVFNFYYRPQAPGDALPKVISFDVQPSGSILSGNLTAGQTISSFSFLVTCKRDQEKDLILSLQTDRGPFASKSSADGSFSSNKEIPIGTIVASVLNFEQFGFTSKNNEKSPGGIWTSNKSKWSPCDGRSLPESKYSKISSQTNAPDLRGIFIRGLNSFDPSYTTPPTNSSQLNPENTSLNVYQPDAFQGHKHINSDNLAVNQDTQSPNNPKQRRTVTGEVPENSAGKFDAGFGTPRLSSETRPKNISIFYYIKIN